jgi:16S rRNA (guanine966-N2)-methyltransferase
LKTAPSVHAKSRQSLTSTTQRTANAAGEIRLIGGQWKRTKLSVANKPGLRPTPDRVRETLFNWLGQDMTGMHCVDAFAGTGALGFEAASRGAADVLLVEQDAQLVNQLQTIKTKLQAANVRVQRGDALAALRALPKASADVVFLDPPFESPVFDAALSLAAQCIQVQGAIYLEAPKAWTDEDLAPMGLRVHRTGKAGAVHYHLLVKLSV